MAGRTLTACAAGLELAQAALDAKGWSHATLAKKTIPPDRDGWRQGDSVSARTVQNFFGGKPISVQFFHALCHTLELDWAVVAGQNSPEQTAAASDNEATADEMNGVVIQNIGQNNGTAMGVVKGSVYLGQPPA